MYHSEVWRSNGSDRKSQSLATPQVEYRQWQRRQHSTSEVGLQTAEEDYQVDPLLWRHHWRGLVTCIEPWAVPPSLGRWTSDPLIVESVLDRWRWGRKMTFETWPWPWTGRTSGNPRAGQKPPPDYIWKTSKIMVFRSIKGSKISLNKPLITCDHFPCWNGQSLKMWKNCWSLRL